MSALPVYRAWHKQRRMMYQVVAFNLQEQSVAMSYGDGFGWHVCNPDEMELMQQLPFSSKNDLPVFEGDIVATELGPEYVKSVVRIGESEIGGTDSCWPEKYYGVYLEGSYGLLDELLEGKMYVVGNVWQNPELLQGK